MSRDTFILFPSFYHDYPVYIHGLHYLSFIWQGNYLLQNHLYNRSYYIHIYIAQADQSMDKCILLFLNIHSVFISFQQTNRCPLNVEAITTVTNLVPSWNHFNTYYNMVSLRIGMVLVSFHPIGIIKREWVSNALLMDMEFTSWLRENFSLKFSRVLSTSENIIRIVSYNHNKFGLWSIYIFPA
jgi:hypothetical protein